MPERPCATVVAGRRSPVAGVVLAAGLSRRFGTNKLLEPFGGKPLLSAVVEAALRSRLASVTVVLGHERHRVRDALADFDGEPRLAFVVNDAYRDGQSTSVRSGLAAIPPWSAGAMFLVGDQPLLQSRAIDQLIAAFESGGRICYPSCGGRRGNPVIFDARFFPELQRLSGDSGGRTVIEAYPDAVVPVIFTDESLFRDVDRRADLAMLAAVHGRSHKQTSLARALGLDASRVISLCGAGGKTSLMAALTRELASDGERVLATTTTKMATSELDGPWRACRADDCDDLLARTNDLAAPLLAYRTLARERSRLRGFSVAVIDELAASGRFTRIIVEADGSRRRPLKAPNAREPVLPSATDAVVMVAGVSGLGWPLDDNAVFRPDRWCALTQLRMGETVTPESLARVVVHPDGLARGTQARRILFLNQADTPDRLAAARRVIDSLPAHGGHVPERALIGRLQPEPEICELREFGSRTPAHAEGRNERWGRSTPGD